MRHRYQERRRRYPGPKLQLDATVTTSVGRGSPAKPAVDAAGIGQRVDQLAEADERQVWWETVLWEDRLGDPAELHLQRRLAEYLDEGDIGVLGAVAHRLASGMAEWSWTELLVDGSRKRIPVPDGFPAQGLDTELGALHGSLCLDLSDHLRDSLATLSG